MADYYILDKNKKPIPEPDQEKFTDWYINHDPTVRQNAIDECLITTVFMGVDMSPTSDKQFLYETVVTDRRDPSNVSKPIYASSWDEAEEKHEYLLDVLAPPGRAVFLKDLLTKKGSKR